MMEEEEWSLPDVFTTEASSQLMLMQMYGGTNSREETLSLVRRAYKRAKARGKTRIGVEDLDAIYDEDRAARITAKAVTVPFVGGGLDGQTMSVKEPLPALIRDVEGTIYQLVAFVGGTHIYMEEAAAYQALKDADGTRG